MQSLRDTVLILIVASMVLFFNLGRPRLWDRDEPRNAGCAREMLERGDWVVPVFNAELRTHKPVLLYWFMMTAYSVFGVGEFGARFWSAALGIGTVGMTYLIGRRLFDRTVGLWSALILVTFVMFGVVGRAATPDSTLLFFCTAAMAVFVHSVWPAKNGSEDNVSQARSVVNDAFPRLRMSSLAMYGLMGFAVLAKGPVGLVLPTAVIGMFCLIERSPTNGSRGLSSTIKQFCSWFHPLHFLKTCWAMRPLTALAVVACVAGPWYAWVGVRTDGAWLSGFLGEHNLGRALRPMEGHSGPTLFFYPSALLVCCFPWSILAIPTVANSVTNLRGDTSRQKQSTIFLACWVCVYVVIFSIARTKLPSYIAPTFPAVAILIGAFVVGILRAPTEFNRRWARAGMIVLTLVGIALSIGLTLALRQYLPRESGLSLIALIPVAAGVVGVRLLDRRHTQAAMQTLMVSAAAFSILLFGVLSVRVSHYQTYDRLLDPLASQRSTAVVGAFGRLEPTWVFYAGQPIEFFTDEKLNEAVRFLAQPNAVMVTTESRMHRLRDAVASPLRVMSKAPYFLQDDKLFLVTTKQAVASNN